jgi:hypothetical protein
MDTVCVHPDWRQDLECLSTVRVVKRDPALLREPQGSVETRHVGCRCQAELGLQLFPDPITELLGRLPRDDLKIVEILV